MSTYLLFFGPPGSGKSTQGALLSTRKGLPHVSIGELLRAEARTTSPRGVELARFMGQGAMVADGIVAELLRERLSALDLSHGFILDGFPRADHQLELLEQMFTDLELRDYRAVDIDIPREESFQRLSLRGRADDTPEVINRRLDAYRVMTEPVLAYFARRDVLITIDGTGSIEKVAEGLEHALGQR